MQTGTDRHTARRLKNLYTKWQKTRKEDAGINPLFRLLEEDPEIWESSRVYFSTYMMGSVFLLMEYNGVCIMNFFGISSYPLFMSITSTVLHIAGNLFILPVPAVSVICAKWCCSVFLPANSTGESFETALIFVRYYLPFVLFNMITNLFRSFYRGMATMGLLATATVIGAVSGIAAAYIAVKHMGMNGAYLG